MILDDVIGVGFISLEVNLTPIALTPIVPIAKK